MDGDNDVIVGYNYTSQTQWSGVSIIRNNGNGNFYLHDSVFLYAGQSDILLENLNTLPNKEIIGNYIDELSGLFCIATINDFNLSEISYFAISDEAINDKALGDINGDGNLDIVIASYSGQFWGVLYNDGSGNFSEPEYIYIDDYYASDLSCGDLNGDNRDDVVLCGQSTEVYFSYSTGFELLLLESNDYKDEVSISDFDLDEDMDILTFKGFGGSTFLKMYENKGNNTFDTIEQFIFQPMSSKFFVSDFNNDSLNDILFQLSDKSGYIIYYNQGHFQLGDSQFVPLPPSSPQEGWRNCYSADMDGNGFNDIIVVKTLYVYLPDNLGILFNDGHGNFQEDPILKISNSKIQISNSKLKCYPNPFRDIATFEINTEQTAGIELLIYNMQGKLITTLSNKIERHQNYHIVWNGSDETGKTSKSGTYIVVLMVNEKPVQSIRIIKY